MAATKIPLRQHKTGVLLVDGKIGGTKRTFVLDTKATGVMYSCGYSSPDASSSSRSSALTDPRTCPEYPGDSSLFKTPFPNGNSVLLDPIMASLEIGSYSDAQIKVGRAPSSEAYEFFDMELYEDADAILGLGSAASQASSFTQDELDDVLTGLQWSSFSLYLAETTSTTGSFLLPSSVDADLIKSNGLVEVPIPTRHVDGWKLNMTSFLVDGVENLATSCNDREGVSGSCDAAVLAASPVIQVYSNVWKELETAIPWDRHACSTQLHLGIRVYECDDDIELPRFGFGFGDKTLFLGKEHYTIPVPDTTRRVRVLLAEVAGAWDYPAMFYLGTPFLRTFYTSFAKESISVYCSDGVNCASNVVGKAANWEEQVDTSPPVVNAMRTATSIVCAITVVFMLALAGYVTIRKKRRAVTAASADAEIPSPDVFVDVSTPTGDTLRDKDATSV